MTSTPKPLDAQALMDAWAANDVQAVLRHYRDDVVLHHGSLEVHGKEDLRGFLEGLLGALGSWRIEPRLVVQKEGESFGALLRLKGSFKGDVTMGGETFPSKGKRFDFDLADFGTLDADGRIRSEWQLHDNLVLLAQMGVPAARLGELASLASEAPPP